MSQSGDEKSTFSLTFRSEMDSAGPDISEYMNVYRVDGKSGRAIMLLNRQGGDLPNKPIGLFTATLSTKQTGAIAAAFDRIKWDKLPPLEGGDISAAMLSIDYARGSRVIHRDFNARNGAFLHAIAPVMTQVDEIGSMTFKHPERAITLAVERTDRGFKLIIRNVGTGPVLLSDARAPGESEGGTCGTISVAERVDTPSGLFAPDPVFKPVAFPPLGEATASIALAVGQVYAVETVAWSAPKPGRYFAKAQWMDYVGPRVDPKSIMPMIPDPADAADTRPYLIRGAVFSSALQLTVDKPTP